jgi:hypothetical protein
MMSVRSYANRRNCPVCTDTQESLRFVDAPCNVSGANGPEGVQKGAAASFLTSTLSLKKPSAAWYRTCDRLSIILFNVMTWRYTFDGPHLGYLRP